MVELKRFQKFRLGFHGLMAAMTAAAFVLCGVLTAGAAELKFHHDLPEDSAQHLAAEKFKAAVESRTEGKIKVTIFPSNALGNDVETTQQMQFGAIQGGIIPTAKLSNFVPSLQLIDLPFLFPSPAVAHKVLDSQAGDKLLATLDKSGLKGVTFWESGFKQFTCNHAVVNPADFKGYKVRVMQSPIIMEQFKALGANPVPIAFTETYNALQQRVVDCQENPLVSITKMKFYEVQSNLIISNHAYLGYAFVFSKKWFDGLNPEEQKILVEAAREMTSFEREETARRESGYVKTITESGTKVSQLNAAELEKFQAATRPVHKKFAQQIGQDLLDAFYTEIDKAAAEK
jgi:tripartite ATP-independent transporter DctP family solute receptor